MAEFSNGLETLVAIARGLLSALGAAPIEEREVARIIPKQNRGLGVSTIQINDIPGWEYETAILDAQAFHAVERYHTPAEAKAGHLRWVEASKDLVTVISLGGWEGAGPDGEVQLNRMLS